MEDENELVTPKQEETPKINLAKAPEKPVATLAPSMFWLKVVRFERRMTASLRIFFALATCIFAIWASNFIYKELNSNDFMLNSFDVPEEFEKQGYKGHILVSKIAIQIASMKKMTRSSYSEDRKYKDKDIGADLNIDVAGMGVSLKSIVEQLRQSLGIERKSINGYVTLHDKKLQLTVTISNRGSEVFEQSLDSMNQYDALEKTLLQASELILQNTDPIVMMNYYFQTKKKGKNIELAKYLLIYEPKYSQWAYLSWASGLRLENDNEGAIEMLKRALEADSTLSDAWNSWGSILRNQKKYDEAIEKYQKAIACNPEYLLPYNNLAFVHFLKEEYDMAITKSKELIAKNEEFGYPYSILAQCYAKKNNEELFYKNLEIALKYKVPVWTWLKTDPWDKYVGQERFDKLIQKYRLD